MLELRSLFGLLLVSVEIDEASTRADGRPFRGMMQAEMPSARAAHRESPQRNPLTVDANRTIQIGHCLEDVGLARPAVGVVRAAEDVELHPRLFLRQRFTFVP